MIKHEDASKYPDTLYPKFGEGGRTFLHRVFQEHLHTGKPIIISTGNLYLQYKYSPTHTSFADGITIIDGQDDDAKERFFAVTADFNLDIAIENARYIKNPDGTIQKKSLSPILDLLNHRIRKKR